MRTFFLRGFWALGLALVLTSCGEKSDPVSAANAFFEQVGQGQMQQAYESAAFGFRAQQDEKLFAQTAKEMKFAEFASAQWETPEIDGRAAKLRGEVVTKDGAKFPLQLSLNQESGAWRIFSIRKPRDAQTGFAANVFGTVGKGKGFSARTERPIPNLETIRELTLETMLSLDDAIRTRSFEGFYAKTSRAWQDQLTVGQLQRTFQPFVDKNISLDDVRNVEPVFNPEPYLSSEGLLVVTGQYPTKDFRVLFSLKFLYELPKWRLFGIDVNLQRTP